MPVTSPQWGQTWAPEQGYTGKSTYNADVYVFCVQTEKDRGQGDALNLNLESYREAYRKVYGEDPPDPSHALRSSSAPSRTTSRALPGSRKVGGLSGQGSR